MCVYLIFADHCHGCCTAASGFGSCRLVHAPPFVNMRCICNKLKLKFKSEDSEQYPPSAIPSLTGKQKSPAASHTHIDTVKEANRTKRTGLQVQGNVVAIKHPCILPAPSKHH